MLRIKRTYRRICWAVCDEYHCGVKPNAGVPKSGATKSGDLLPVSTKSGGPKSGETKSGMGQNPV